MEERLYLILDSKGTPLANAVLESPPSSEVLQLQVLGGKVEQVMAHREIQLIGVDDGSPDRVGVIVRQREDKIVVQPTTALGPAARENLRIPTDFNSVAYPISGRWRGQRRIKAKDLSCGGIAFYADCQLELHEQMEIVVTPTEEPVILRCEILRKQELQNDRFLYATKFVDMCEDEEVVVREAVFSLQLQSRDV